LFWVGRRRSWGCRLRLLRLGSGSLIDGWRHDGSDRNGRGLVDRNNWSFVGRRWDIKSRGGRLDDWRRGDDNDSAFRWAIGDLRPTASDSDLGSAVNRARLLRRDGRDRAARSWTFLRDADDGGDRTRESTGQSRICHVGRCNL
jgi:hypothetical protein